MEPSRQLSAGAVPIFREGILLTLSRWWALQMAVVQEWGGRNSALIAEQLGEDVLSWFTQSKEPLYIDDLEQILENGLMSLNTMEEDGSTEEVAEKLMILHEECLEGNFTSIQKLREASATEAGHSRISKVGDNDDEDCSDTDESMEMAVDAPENQPCQAPETVVVKEPKPAQAVDPDGWTVVEGLVVSEAKLNVVVCPSKNKRIPEAVLHELGFHLFKYNEIFGGVLLAYDIRILGKETGVLRDILPLICVSLTGKLLVFNPKRDMMLEGTVVKLAQESIHVVVLGFASAVIVDEDIREELQYVDGRDGQVYQSKYHKRHVIKIGTVVRFQVKSLDEDIIHICGSLAATGTGSVKWLEKRNVGTQMLDSKKGGEKTSQDTCSGRKESDYSHSVKRSKKRKLNDEL